MIRPLVSIITVAYNAEDSIARTIESVAGQSCTLYEHIIKDGASTDHTIKVAESLKHDRMVLVSNPDRGIYDAMNEALSMAKGDYVLFLNCGDTLHSTDTLQKIADAILDNDYPGIVYGQTDIVDANGAYLGPRHLLAPGTLSLRSFKDGMVVCHQSFVALRQIVGYFNTHYRYSADYEWCIIALQHSKRNVYLPITISDYLAQGASTKHHFASLRERFSIMCTYYGFLPTVFRHFKFLVRYLKRRKTAANKQ